MKKILIIYATAGIGHKKAAIAVKKALDEIGAKDTEVTLIDSLDYTNDFFKWSYLQAYLTMVNKLPTFWGISYHLTDNFYVNLIVSKIRRISNWMNSKKLIEYLKKTEPDVIISTHFFASEVIADLKESGSIKARLITVVTDYRLHSWWIGEGTDVYVVASEEAKLDLLKWKVDPARIKVMGIPVEPVFSKKLDRQSIFDKAGLKDGVFTVLVIGGGFGVGPIEAIVKSIGGMAGIQIVVVCGHNEELVKKIEALKSEFPTAIKVLGFVDNVYEYMEIANILISKSGGITVSESLAKDLPMIVIAPIIGQETRNADFMVKNKAAFRINDTSELKATIEPLLKDPKSMDSMKKAIDLIKKPMACYDVAKLAMDMINGK